MDYLDVIGVESDRFYTTAEKVDPSQRVPSCPEWSIADLVWHLGEVHWFWGTDVELRATEPQQVEKAKPPRPTGYPELVAWGRAQADRMIQILREASDDEPVWTWALEDADHCVGFVRRHQVQEAIVHRWDMQNAAASAIDPIDAAAAADSIDEFLAITLPWAVKPERSLQGSVHIHCTDADGEWLINPDGRVALGHEKGDAVIRGTAADILLVLYGRIPLETVEPAGDAAIAAQLLERINTE
jgi:uncharacterized protein (TIGR03083 family)